MNKCASGINKLFRDDGQQNWLSLDATTDSNGINPYLKTLFNAIGKKCAENGIQYGYHNHAYEYEKVEDQVMYDYMLEHTDPQYVFFQMDVYWTMRGGKSQVEYFKKYPGRFKMLHIKDECELGQSGMVGFDAIFKNIKEAGTKEIIVEVERYSMPVIESIKESIDYLLQSDFVPASYE